MELLLPWTKLAENLYKANRIASTYKIRLVSIADRFIRGLDEHKPQIEDCIAPNGGVSLAYSGLNNWSLCDMNWHNPKFVFNKFPYNKFKLKSIKLKKLLPYKKCISCYAKLLCGGPCPNDIEICSEEQLSYRCDFFRAATKIAIFHKNY